MINAQLEQIEEEKRSLLKSIPKQF
jgi:hypothetical protein